ncbi:uncharacterized protein I303_100028 [Kwoniella dejecticola CBS 10117]|uniref:DNA mismatch repair proteins mutS family domain-containing protein n=1 Tax=Kwoniella dejecticola CBS 10117 TaxID=1296121 RepID=A0AAJ8MBQ4_9TREE
MQIPRKRYAPSSTYPTETQVTQDQSFSSPRPTSSFEEESDTSRRVKYRVSTDDSHGYFTQGHNNTIDDRSYGYEEGNGVSQYQQDLNNQLSYNDDFNDEVQYLGHRQENGTFSDPFQQSGPYAEYIPDNTFDAREEGNLQYDIYSPSHNAEYPQQTFNESNIHQPVSIQDHDDHHQHPVKVFANPQYRSRPRPESYLLDNDDYSDIASNNDRYTVNPAQPYSEYNYSDTSYSQPQPRSELFQTDPSSNQAVQSYHTDQPSQQYSGYDYSQIPYPTQQSHTAQRQPVSTEAVQSYNTDQSSTSYGASHTQSHLTLPRRAAKSVRIKSELTDDEHQEILTQAGGVASDGNIGRVLDVSAHTRPWTEPDITEEGTGENGSSEKKRKVLALYAPSRDGLAAAWYDPETRKMEILEDTKDTRGWDLAVLVLEQVQPDLILMSSRNDSQMVEVVQTWDQENLLEEATEGSTRILIVPGKQCNYNSAIGHLSAVRLPDRSVVIPSRAPLLDSASVSDTLDGMIAQYPEDTTGMGSHRLNLVKLGCWVDVHAPLAVIAAGQLVSELKYGSSDGFGESSEFKNGVLELSSLESMELDRHMQINQDALTSLAIFSVEDHAAAHVQRMKRALSIHGLLDTCVTPLGKKMLHTWLLRPLASLKQIQARHEAVALFSARINNLTAEILCRIMKRIRNLPNLFWKLRHGTARYQDWKAIRESFDAIVEVRTTVLGVGWTMPVEIVEKIRTNVDTKLDTISSFMGKVIDWYGSKDQSRMAVAPGFNDDLDNLREIYSGLDALLTEVSRVLLAEIPRGAAQDFSVIYLPHIGFHSVIVTEEALDSPEIPGWTPRFKTTDKHYYKNSSMVDLDNHYGDIYVMMTNLEVEIIQDLNEELQSHEPIINAAVDVIAELDCLLAFAKAAQTFSLVRPKMTTDTTLQIHQGRHLLYEHVTDNYIPNDTYVVGGTDPDHHNMMIITGANGSGKSAYGKQVALIVFMAQIGCFVPAQGAVIGICDKIFTRLQTKESSTKHASAFMIDLSQVSQALRGATEKSLIILDEFGKGTISWDGAGLLAGTIKYLQTGPRPRSVVLTHFHELITQEFVQDRDGIAFAHMSAHMVPEMNEVYFLYTLDLGPSKGSHAADCALQHGIPKEVVERAKYVTECVSKFDLSKLHDNKLTPAREAELKANEELAKKFLSWTFDGNTQVIRDVIEDMLEDTEINKFKIINTVSDPSDSTRGVSAEDDDEEIDELDSDSANSDAYSNETD